MPILVPVFWWKEIRYCGRIAVVGCDGNCKRAFGLNTPPNVRPGEDPDDAPINPGTYEGGDAKPVDAKGHLDMNKWCVRECERSVIGETASAALAELKSRLAAVAG